MTHGRFEWEPLSPAARSEIQEYYVQSVPVPYRGFMSILDAIFGTAYTPAHAGLDFSATSGPWLDGLKRDWIDVDTRWVHPTLQELIKENLRDLQRGVRPRHIESWMTLKDELRVPGKEFTPRAYYSGCFNWVVIEKVFFWPFLARFRERPTETRSAIGISPQSNDPAYLILHAYGKDAGEGDYEKMDKRLYPDYLSIKQYAHVDRCRIANGDVFYIDAFGELFEFTPDVYNILWEVINWCHIIILYLLILWFGNPSGSWITGYINDEEHHLHKIDYYVHNVPTDLRSFDHFKTHFDGRSFGDDFFTLTSKEARSWFDILRFAEFVLKRGARITIPQKDVALRPYTPVRELTFLKRNFCYEDGVVTMRRPIEDILQALFWKQKNFSDREYLRQCALSVLDELVLHPAPVFKLWSDRIIGLFSELYNETLSYPSWSERRRLWGIRPLHDPRLDHIFSESKTEFGPAVTPQGK
jgi:hypothetical protein